LEIKKELKIDGTNTSKNYKVSRLDWREKKQKTKTLHTEEEVQLPKLEEVRMALQFLNNNTAIEVDKIPAEILYKIGGGGCSSGNQSEYSY
jgi:hypothetical protein